MGRFRRHRTKRQDITPQAWAVLNDQEPPPDPEGLQTWTGWELEHDFSLATASPITSELWAEYREVILPRWALDQPGRRPSWWWRIDAPEPRRRLGGTGTARSDCLSVLPLFDRGLPAHWITPWEVAYYAGKTESRHGRIIGPDGDLWAQGHLPPRPLAPHFAGVA